MRAAVADEKKTGGSLLVQHMEEAMAELSKANVEARAREPDGKLQAIADRAADEEDALRWRNKKAAAEAASWTQSAVSPLALEMAAMAQAKLDLQAELEHLDTRTRAVQAEPSAKLQVSALPGNITTTCFF